MGIEAPIMGQPGLYSQNVIDIAGDASEGLLCSGVFVAAGADEKGQEFVIKYGEKYNGEVPDGFAAWLMTDVCTGRCSRKSYGRKWR